MMPAWEEDAEGEANRASGLVEAARAVGEMAVTVPNGIQHLEAMAGLYLTMVCRVGLTSQC